MNTPFNKPLIFLALNTDFDGYIEHFVLLWHLWVFELSTYRSNVYKWLLNDVGFSGTTDILNSTDLRDFTVFHLSSLPIKHMTI